MTPWTAREIQFTSLDLFCGAGGLTEGFRLAGFESLYGNDVMPEAIETFRVNHPRSIPDPRPIQEIKPKDVRRKLAVGKGDVDVLVGGPPCQGFSINAPGRFLDDPRNALFRFYESFLEEFEPKTFVFENVPGLLSLGNGGIFHEIVGIFAEQGYSVNAKILFAAHYGVPQERWRLIIIGSRLGGISHPAPTHYALGRANFRGGGLMTFKLDEEHRNRLQPFTTVGDAIIDLPRLAMGEGGEVLEYSSAPLSDYATWIRNPTGELYNHYAARLSPQNIERMNHVPAGGSWRDIPDRFLPEGMKRARKSDHTKRYGRLRYEGLSGTVLTKCDPHWGAVFLPDQNRTLTVREAARLQSFPDAYRFFGSRVSQYIQVGNAVPVLMAKAVALRIRDHLEATSATTLAPREKEVAIAQKNC